jgi:hypothetical protein
MVPRDRAGGGGSRTKCGRWTARVEWRRKRTPPAPISSPSWRLGLEPRFPSAAYFQRRSSNANSLWRRALVEPTQVITATPQVQTAQNDATPRHFADMAWSPYAEPVRRGQGRQEGEQFFVRFCLAGASFLIEASAPPPRSSSLCRRGYALFCPRGCALYCL